MLIVNSLNGIKNINPEPSKFQNVKYLALTNFNNRQRSVNEILQMKYYLQRSTVNIRILV